MLVNLTRVAPRIVGADADVARAMLDAVRRVEDAARAWSEDEGARAWHQLKAAQAYLQDVLRQARERMGGA